MRTCDVCKGRPGVKLVRPWGNPNYAELSVCQECDDKKILYRTS